MVHAQEIARFRRRLGGVLFLRAAVGGAVAWMVAWGVTVLVFRAATDIALQHLLWGAAGLVAVLVFAAVRAYRGVPSPASVRAMLDRQSRMGGLLMAEDEVELGAWTSSVAQPTLPTVYWQSGRLVGMCAISVLFVAAVFLIPSRYVRATGPQQLQITKLVEQTQEQIELLEEERIVEADEAQQMQEQLERIQDQAKGDDPIKTWESLDHLKEKLAEAAKEAAEKGIRETETIADTQTMADALMQQGDQLDAATMDQAMQTLADMMQQMMEDNAAVSDHLSEAMQAAIEAGAIDPRLLGDLLKQLDGRKMAVADMIDELADLRLIDMRMCELCEGAGELDTEGFCQSLIFNLNQAQVDSGKGGRGGLMRGRGDADMVWKQNPSNEQGAAFEEQALPPAQLAALRESKLIGVSLTTPEVDEEAAPSAGGALTNTTSDGGSAATHVVLPRHRAAVQRYFDHEQTDSK